MNASSQNVVRKEILHIAAGTGIGLAVMLLVFTLLGRLNGSVVLAGVLGSVIAVLNFVALALTVKKATQAEGVRSKNIMQLSYSLRMLAMGGWMLLCVTLAQLHWIAGILPLLFPRVTILAMQALGMYKPEPKTEGAAQTAVPTAEPVPEKDPPKPYTKDVAKTPASGILEEILRDDENDD